ncbi:hypothetical protein JAO10_09175 [Burkholderia contaminans]|uniref:hypothetical protein n=1 Tax=Burkholderia contaminans TaxID=488447 RepID=UPI0018DEC765|nr:hypothetical protein [Burkholderia contaminans]MBH9720503.1 hypothetical protein [Burkholderia contaminans]
MKYELDSEQVKYVLEESFVSISDYVKTLNEDQEEKYLSIYANILLEKIEEKEADVLEEAKGAIQEYYDYQELSDDGYWFPGPDFTEEDHEFLDQCEAENIDYDKWEWDEGNLLGYIVDSDWTHCSRDYGLVYVNNQHVYFDKDNTKNDKIAAEVEELAKKHMFKLSLEENLQVGSKNETRIKI